MEKPFFQQHAPESSSGGRPEAVSPVSLFVRRNLLSVVIGAVSISYFVASHQHSLLQALAKQTPQSRQITLSAATDGTVEQVSVIKGEHVRLNTPLVLLSDENKQTLKVSQLISEQLKLEQSSLLQDIEHTQQIALQQASDNKFQKVMLNGQLEQLSDQIKIESAQISMTQNLLDKWRPLLAKGYVSTLQFEQEQSLVWGYESQYRSLLRQQYSTRQQLSVSDDQQRQIYLSTSLKLNVLRRQLAQVDENLLQNADKQERIFYPPSAGTVGAVFAKAGDVITSGQPLLTIEPDNQQDGAGLHYQKINDLAGNTQVIPHHGVSAHKV